MGNHPVLLSDAGYVCMSTALLEMKDVVIEAEIDGKWQSIVNGLSLSLKKGEIVGLIGEYLYLIQKSEQTRQERIS